MAKSKDFSLTALSVVHKATGTDSFKKVEPNPKLRTLASAPKKTKRGKREA